MISENYIQNIEPVKREINRKGTERTEQNNIPHKVVTTLSHPARYCINASQNERGASKKLQNDKTQKYFSHTNYYKLHKKSLDYQKFD